MDKYDLAIEEIVKVQGQKVSLKNGKSQSVLSEIWDCPGEYRECGGALCQYLSHCGFIGPIDAGCPIMIGSGHVKAETDELTQAVLEGGFPERIDMLDDLRDDELRKALRPFAEIQRKADALLGR